MRKAKYLTKVTDLTKIILENAIKEGDIVVDATVGNGYDTEYLAKKVGERGKVYGFDIQKIALDKTKERLQKNDLLERVSLILDGHENMDKYIKEEVSCIYFNLGYLPRGDHKLITKAETTILALEKSLKLLKSYGIISIALYTGHEGGLEEKDAVEEFLANLDQNYYNVLKCNFINQKNNPPQLVLVEKKMVFKERQI
ncbi:class I SAM-dependent methyltransferase [Tepidibacter formicigenes]|uniref:Putative rRNA methylase n=1 Tax=Tepidibacter formicigenes DSM 15518 TaxID=1123349 RepID=A0A1M6M9B6_9FIRM|nr:class I SAM-dependent methyltransferase [Tepidibacter formicigenes]SHJ80067.1 Putative rRNA methylase [Tepidibacter formicigenes DSM 15518]